MKLQKWAIRTISNSHYRSYTHPLFAKHNILKVNGMYSLELGVCISIPSMIHLIFIDSFTKHSNIHGYHTRHANDFILTTTTKTKQNKTKQNKTKQKKNKTKQNKTKQNKTKQSKAKQNKTKQNKTKNKQTNKQTNKKKTLL